MAPSGVSKESNGRIPVIGQAVRALQTVYIPYDKLSKRNGSGGDSGGGRGGGVKGTGANPAVHVPKDCSTAAATMTAAATATALHMRPSDAVSAVQGSGAAAAAAAAIAATDDDGKALVNKFISGANSSPSNCASPCSDRSSSSSSSNGNSNSSASSKKALGRASSSSCSAIETNRVCTDGAEGAASGNAACAEAPPAAPAPPAAAPAPAVGSLGRSDVVKSRVTEVLLRRVHHPSYCKPGGFPMVVMAPEGTTSNGRGLLNFRTGAFVLGRTVLPICFRYRWRGLNPAWTIGDERWHFLRLMSQFRNDLEIEILPPYKPSFDELKVRDLAVR
ncbi:hypothetical protein Vafri_15928 [Volvox africanus]|uniref:Phospholipid/glycerol acyltransferase domain-containing protein n=1 Tax=Volvox africanus TaxID=51714 RepID=A0A8J4BHR5_9CHLO|nr:hypothetical protein Vafri_15928 [Volvox africanus]